MPGDYNIDFNAICSCRCVHPGIDTDFACLISCRSTNLGCVCDVCIGLKNSDPQFNEKKQCPKADFEKENQAYHSENDDITKVCIETSVPELFIIKFFDVKDSGTSRKIDYHQDNSILIWSDACEMEQALKLPGSYPLVMFEKFTPEIDLKKLEKYNLDTITQNTEYSNIQPQTISSDHSSIENTESIFTEKSLSSFGIFDVLISMILK